MKNRIGIIGGGISGLTAAYEILKEKPHTDIDIFERNGFLGGLLGSINIGGHNIEVYYHHTFPGDKPLYTLMEELDIIDKIKWQSGSVGFLYKGKMWGFNTPLDLLSFPLINLYEKMRVGVSVLTAKGVGDWRSYDNESAKDYITRVWGKSVYEKLWVPLLSAKFGKNAEKISAAWFIKRIQLRSHRGAKGEKLAYPYGGWQILIDKIEAKIKSLGGNIHIEEMVNNISKNKNGYEIETEKGKYTYSHIISTIPQPIYNNISPFKITPVLYQGCISNIVILKRKVQKYYWINISDKDAAFSVMVEHTNFFKENPYPYHIVYLALYTDGEKISKETLNVHKERFLTYFKKVFGINDSEIIENHMFYSRFAGPIYEVGYRGKLPPKKIENENIFIGGIPRSYPERSINDSISQGKECANMVLEGINERKI